MSNTQKAVESAAPVSEGKGKPKSPRRTGGNLPSKEVASKKMKTALLTPSDGHEQPVEAAFANASAVNAALASETPAASPKSTKQEQVLTMLSQAGGVTIEEVMKATGWQQHSVRGFFAGTVRKKLGFELMSDKPEGEERRYAIEVAA